VTFDLFNDDVQAETAINVLSPFGAGLGTRRSIIDVDVDLNLGMLPKFRIQACI